MLLSKEIRRDEHSTFKKELFYNDQQQVIATLERTKVHDTQTEGGYLTLYEYTGKDCRELTYSSDTKSYQQFSAAKLAAGTRSWYSVEEANATRDYKYENGLLVTENYHNRQYEIKHLITYAYKNGIKATETKTIVDGTVYKTEFMYENGRLQSKLILRNGQFYELYSFTYNKEGLLAQEERMLKYKDTQFPSTLRKFFYNAAKVLEKTEYYGRYDNKMPLYKVEENIRKGNVLTKKISLISNLEMAVGYLHLEALYEWLRKEQMEWGIAIYNKQFLDTAVFDAQTCNVEVYDAHEQLVESRVLNPYDDNKEVAKVLFRNEYGEAGQLEFTIMYRVEDNGEKVEGEIRKLYYRD